MKLDENVNNGENFILLQAYILILRTMIILMKKLIEFIHDQATLFGILVFLRRVLLIIFQNILLLFVYSRDV